jgi:hypothetical protein
MAAARITELKKMKISFGINKAMPLFSNWAKAREKYENFEICYLD